MTKLQFIIGWILLTIILFSLGYFIINNIRLRKYIKKIKEKYSNKTIVKINHILINVIELSKEARDDLFEDKIYYFGKIDYIVTKGEELKPIYFTISINFSNDKIKFNFYDSKNKFSINIDNYKIDNKKIKNREKRFLAKLAIIEDSNIVSSTNISGKFIFSESEFNNLDIEESNLVPLKLVL